MGWVDEVSESDNGLNSRTTWEYDQDGRPVSFERQGRPFHGVDGEITETGTVTHDSDNSWTLEEDVGADLGSAGNGSLVFDGLPDTTTGFVYDPDSLTMTITIDEAQDSTTEMVFRSALDPPWRILNEARFILLDVEQMSLHLNEDGQPDLVRTFTYDDEGHLFEVISVNAADEEVGRETYHYTCE
jgi:hypothetical protein